MSQLILASTSPYRRALLERLCLPFEVIAPRVDETPGIDESPLALVQRLAAHKAAAVSSSYPQAIVIGSDQLACLDGRILGKPGTVAKAEQQLHACSGRSVEFLTAVSVCHPGAGEPLHDLDRTQVVFRTLAGNEIRHYIEREQPLDCAGAFKVEGLGITLFERIENNDPTALVGLPMIKLCALLAQLGVSPLRNSDPP